METVLNIILGVISIISAFSAGVYLVKKERYLAMGYGFLALFAGVAFMVRLVA